MSNKEFIAEVNKIIHQHREVLSFQDRLILSTKFGKNGILSDSNVVRELVKTEMTPSNLSCTLDDVANAVQRLVSVLWIQKLWLLDEGRGLIDGDKTKNAPIIAWLEDQKEKIAAILSCLYTSIDEEKMADEKARSE